MSVGIIGGIAFDAAIALSTIAHGSVFLAANVAGVAAAAAVGTAVVTTIALADVRPGQAAKAEMEDEMRFKQKQAELNTSPTHGEFFANDWNYMEKITTDYDRETNTCKRCITSRKCKKGKWSLVRNRYCKSWEEWEEEPRCNELQF